MPVVPGDVSYNYDVDPDSVSVASSGAIAVECQGAGTLYKVN